MHITPIEYAVNQWLPNQYAGSYPVIGTITGDIDRARADLARLRGEYPGVRFEIVQRHYSPMYPAHFCYHMVLDHA